LQTTSSERLKFLEELDHLQGSNTQEVNSNNLAFFALKSLIYSSVEQNAVFRNP